MIRRFEDLEIKSFTLQWQSSSPFTFSSSHPSSPTPLLLQALLSLRVKRYFRMFLFFKANMERDMADELRRGLMAKGTVRVAIKIKDGPGSIVWVDV